MVHVSGLMHPAAAYMSNAAPPTSAAANIAVAEGLSSALAGGISMSRRQCVSSARNVAMVALSCALQVLGSREGRSEMLAADGTHLYHASTRSPASMRWRVLTIDTAVVLSTRRSALRPSIMYATGGFAYAH